MKDEIAIKVEGVSKYFGPSSGSGSIKSNFANIFRTKENKKDDGYWAVKDVSFEVKKGEFFGIVGRNGSGKSTLLKMIAGVYTPTKGNIQVNGNLVPFIELGVGFNHELSGRDNVFLNGALLGFDRKEMESMYDEIVEFAELEDHMDVRLKNFSSGMQVRLAFSIAIRAKSDILLIDEVLAVGDTIFQKKCYSYFRNLQKQKKTVILVSHDMAIIKEYCEKAIIIQESLVVKSGTPNEIAMKYEKIVYNKLVKDNNISSKHINLISDKGFSVKVNNSTPILYDDYLIIDIKWPKETIGVKNVGVSIIGVGGSYVHGNNSIIQNISYANKYRATVKYKLSIGSGKYSMSVGLFGETDNDIVRYCQDVDQFEVAREVVGGKPEWQGITNLETEWR
jgi:ABC-2 type transport system ATP-binding protein